MLVLRFHELTDFAAFHASGRAALQGHNPFCATSSTGLPNMNPPVILPVLAHLATLELASSIAIWRAASLAIYAATSLWLLKMSGLSILSLRFLWLFSISSFWFTIALGQIYVLLLPIVVAALALDRNSDALASGFFIGVLVAAKPNFALWPLALLLAGHTKVAFAAGITALLLWALPLPVYGFRIYQQWLSAATASGALVAFPNNVSLPGVASHLGLPKTGWVLSAAAVALLLAWVLARHPDSAAIAPVAMVASLLASPIGWNNYALLLVPFLLKRVWSWRLRISGLLMLTPFILNPSLAPYPIVLDFIGIAPLLLLVAEEVLYPRHGGCKAQPRASTGESC